MLIAKRAAKPLVNSFSFFNFIFGCRGLHCCARAFLVAESRVARPCSARLLPAGASPVQPQLEGTRASVVVVPALGRPAACGIFPDQGSNPCSLHWQADS